jgi:hypothetical protein
MSAFGPKRTSLVALHMSAFGGKADMAFRGANVCFDPIPTLYLPLVRGQCFANEWSEPNANKRRQFVSESSGFTGDLSERGSLITVWLEVRVLPGPPFSFCAPLVSKS